MIKMIFKRIKDLIWKRVLQNSKKCHPGQSEGSKFRRKRDPETSSG